jgi:beta-lactam-binding protein with PASTA domain
MGMKADKARKELLKQHINPQFIEKHAGGVVINQFPKAGVAFDPANPVCVITGQAKPTSDPPLQADTMPSLKGLSLRRAITLARKLNLTLQVSGHGVIYWQSIAAGHTVEYGDICTVKAR